MPRSSERGMMLIELILVAGIIAAMTTALVMNGTSSRADVKVEAAARELESVFSYAQAMGKGGRYRDGDTSTNKFDKGFGVYLTSGGNGASIYGGVGSDQSVVANNKYSAATEVSPRTFSGGVTVTGICVRTNAASACGGGPSELHVIFRRGEPEVAIHTNNTALFYYEAQVTLGFGGQTRTVVVNQGGMIYTQ